MHKRMISVLHRTWDAIAPDVLANAAWSDGHDKPWYPNADGSIPAECATISGESVREIVSDGGGCNMMSFGHDEDAVKHFMGLIREHQDIVLKEAFPYREYGY